MATATKDRTPKGSTATTTSTADPLEQALADAETELASASAEHAAAKRIYADARVAKDLATMTDALARAEAAADLKQDSEGKVAAAQAALRERHVATELEAFLLNAESVALELAGECRAINDLRAALAGYLSTIPKEIHDRAQRRESLRQQLARLDKQFPDDLASELEYRGKVALGGVLRTPQYPMDWSGGRKFGVIAWNGVPLDELLDALSEDMGVRGARIGGQRAVML